ncbi:cilia- and flagella-associated protein 300-like [Babylonia areolata]|uniref:cilia- and flagella-associated protein 300-like n=1 Tax=Babylonia areolata TaxID=304850 RepID=UPI003FD5FA89
MADASKKFTFRLIEGKDFPSLTDKDNQDLLMKWCMKGRVKAQVYTFDQMFQAYEKDQFVLDFFKDENVTSTLQTLSSSGKWSVVGLMAESVTATPVPATTMSMAFFDKLYEDEQIVRPSGAIRKCMDEFFGDLTASDELRQMLLNEDSDSYCTFNESDREQFLFRLFEHLCLGGQICQYEDSVEPYLDLTKQLYKDLISVQKNPDSKELAIISSVFKVTASDKTGVYYPSDQEHRQTFSYLVVDPLKRHLTVLYHRFGAIAFT